MGRANKQHSHDKNKVKLPQVPKTQKSDGVDVEFSHELADQEDIEAQARADAANKRVREK